jgi:hypothetical protein
MTKKDANIYCSLCDDLVYDAKKRQNVKQYQVQQFGDKKKARCYQCLNLEKRVARETDKNVQVE